MQSLKLTTTGINASVITGLPKPTRNIYGGFIGGNGLHMGDWYIDSTGIHIHTNVAINNPMWGCMIYPIGITIS